MRETPRGQYALGLTQASASGGDTPAPHGTWRRYMALRRELELEGTMVFCRARLSGSGSDDADIVSRKYTNKPRNSTFM